MIKVGLAGYGFMGHMHAQCHEATGDSKVVAVAAAGNISLLGGYYNEIKYFTSCLRQGRKSDVVTPAESREAVRICLAVARSTSTGQPMTL